jgi:predicted ATPase/DNA-binding SARP family transcriptional activator
VLQIAVLGPIEVTRDGRRLPVPAGKPSELLVRLALEAGVLVRTERLLDDLWATDAVKTSRNTLQSKVARLRRALGEASVIASGDGGYKLDVEPLQVDALAALGHASTASRLLEAGDDRGVVDVCSAALQLFSGELLQGAGDGAWVRPHRARLEEARMQLVETQLSAQLRLGDADVIGALEAAVADYPLQEGIWQLLITALYRAGRQADALAAYQRLRAQLAEELGLDPGPQLQELEQQILAHDPSLPVSHRAVRAVDPDAPAGNLPSISATLVGRNAELAALRELVTTERLVEVVGPGGVGKTALVIAMGRVLFGSDDAPDGVWLVRLETAGTADDVVDAVIAALGVTGGEKALLERVKDMAAVVILDNCEHVVEAAAALAVRLLDAALGLRILCTSQIPLDVDGEAVFELHPLGVADAVELFTRRANAQRVRRSPESDDAVQDLCRSLDGLPLAIELAAARTKTLSIADISRRLDDRFSVLSDPASRRPERRRALKATIGWSYDLLFPDDQRGLWALASFAGGAPLSAIEFVLEALDVPATAAIDVVGRLANRSLVIVDDEDAPVRYRLLDSIRAFALAALDEANLAERALAAHAEWFDNAASTSTAGVRSGRQAEHLAFARAERANIDAALAWTGVHEPGLALGIANGYGWAWVVLGDSRGAQRILAALDAAGPLAQPEDRADALLLAGWIEASAGQLDVARAHVEAAAELAGSIGDTERQARSCYYLAYVVSHDGRFREALELTNRSHELYDTLDRPWDQAANGLFAARAATSAGDQVRAGEALDDVEGWLRSADDPWLRVRHEAARGELARVQHRFEDAVLHLGRAAETSGQLGFLQTQAYQLSSLGRAQCQAGDYAAGAATLALAIDKAEATGDVRMAALGRVHLGRVLRALGDDSRARAALEAASAWHRAAGGGEQAELGECLLAAMDAADHVPDAEERLLAILEQARADDATHVEVFALDALARIAADAGDIERALDLCELADSRVEAVSHFITDLDRADAHRVRQLV